MTGIDFLRGMRRYAVSIILIVAVSIIAGFAYVKAGSTPTAVEKKYLASASTHLRINMQNNESINNIQTSNSVVLLFDAQQRDNLPYYTSDNVFEKVINENSLEITIDDLRKQTKVLTSMSDFTTTVYVLDVNKDQAHDIATSIVSNALDDIKRVSSEKAGYSVVRNNETTVEEVDSSFDIEDLVEDTALKTVKENEPTPLGKKKILAIAFALGLVLGVLQAFVRWVSDKKIYTLGDASQIVSDDIIGALPQSKNIENHPVISTLRSALIRGNKDKVGRHTVFTSPRLSSDTSVIAKALAIRLGMAQQKVLYIDTQVEGDKGLAAVVKSSLSDNIHSDFTEISHGCYLVPRDVQESECGDILASPQYADFVRACIEEGWHIIVNAPGVLDNAAALVPSLPDSHVIFTISSGNTIYTDVLKAQKNIKYGNHVIDGVILTDVPASLTYKLRYSKETHDCAYVI
ncbi:MAG: hypothetical protein J6M18_03670 [Actinomycetaceae bacterium]|nr:hypothetical protein [Actinomycetaceae bacterium]